MVLGILVRDFGATLICTYPLIRNIAFVIHPIPSESLLLAVWWPLFLVALQRGNEPTKQSGHRSISYLLRTQSNLVHPVG